jgi:hypothetical protein
MTPEQVTALCDTYIAQGNYVHRVRQGYRALSPSKRQELNRYCDPTPTAYGSYNKTNPHTFKRWSYHENK